MLLKQQRRGKFQEPSSLSTPKCLHMYSSCLELTGFSLLYIVTDFTVFCRQTHELCHAAVGLTETNLKYAQV